MYVPRKRGAYNDSDRRKIIKSVLEQESVINIMLENLIKSNEEVLVLMGIQVTN